MIQNNLFSFTGKFLPDSEQSSVIKKKTFYQETMQVDTEIIEKSVQEFIESIKKGNLYEELKPKELLSHKGTTKI